MTDPIVITGLGLVTPLGHEPGEVLTRLRRGETAACPPARFDPTGFACPRYAPVTTLEAEPLLGDVKTLRLMNHDAIFAAVAARLALRDANLTPGRDYPPEMIALYGATGLAGIALPEVAPLIQHSAGEDGTFDPLRFGRHALHRVRPTLSFKILSNMPICFISIFEHLQGPNAVYNPWEGQGAQAILAGWEALREGRADAALVGGCDVKAHELAFISLQQQGVFESWTTVGTGIVPGEGAAFLVLEREARARARGARPYARLAAGALGTVHLPPVWAAPPAARASDHRSGATAAAFPPRSEPHGATKTSSLATPERCPAARSGRENEPGEEGGAGAAIARRLGGLVQAALADSVHPPGALMSSADGDPRFQHWEEEALILAGPGAAPALSSAAIRLAPKPGLGNLFAAATPVQLAIGALVVREGAGPALVTSFGFGSQQAVFRLDPALAAARAPTTRATAAATAPPPGTDVAAASTARPAPRAARSGEAEPAADGTATAVHHPVAHQDSPQAEPLLFHQPTGSARSTAPTGSSPIARRRVVVTGLGLVGPLGNDLPTFWANLAAGRSGTGPLTLFDASGLLVSIGAEVKDFPVEQVRQWFPAAAQDRDRKVLLGLAAAREALQQAGLAGPDARSRLARAALHVGVSLEVFFLEDVTPLARHGPADGDLGRRLLSGPAGRSPWQTPLDRLAEVIGETYGVGGPRVTNCSACAAGAMVIGEACLALRAGRADLALAGAADSMLNPLGLGGFSLLRALSMNHERPAAACRPFDAARDGTVLGEGAAFLVLETLDHARARGASILAEVLGYGASLDAFRVSDPDPTGRGAVLCMRAALADAGLSSAGIDVVNAHGTGTPKNDITETLALKEVLGPHAYRIPVHAVKSMTGHLIAASGAVEAVVAVQTLRHGLVPPTINLEIPDPECDLDYVPGQARRVQARTVLSNSFAFGGQNATLIFGAAPKGDSP